MCTCQHNVPFHFTLISDKYTDDTDGQTDKDTSLPRTLTLADTLCDPSGLTAVSVYIPASSLSASLTLISAMPEMKEREYIFGN